jgi:hypothetical protein
MAEFPIGRADATTTPLGDPVVVAMTELDAPTVPGRRGTGTVTCTWYDLASVEEGGGVIPQTGAPVDAAVGLVEGQWYELQCTNSDGVIVRRGWRQWTPRDAAILANELAIEAARELPLPHPRPALSPAMGLNQLVGLPTWLWLEDGTWQTLSATASVPGLSATATATPTRAVWDMGDGETVTCEGPGTAYDMTKPDNAQSTDCKHVYQYDSADEPGGAYDVTVSVDWTVTWGATNGQGGTLPGTTRGTTFPVPVTQRQAVVCYGAPDNCD